MTRLGGSLGIRSFLRSAYIAMNLEDDTVGLAQAKYGIGESDVIELL
jgi:hypothetical protein